MPFWHTHCVFEVLPMEVLVLPVGQLLHWFTV